LDFTAAAPKRPPLFFFEFTLVKISSHPGLRAGIAGAGHFLRIGLQFRWETFPCPTNW
jgi:hypothetical protein